jgi:hypothetical protein
MLYSLVLIIFADSSGHDAAYIIDTGLTFADCTFAVESVHIEGVTLECEPEGAAVTGG